MMEQAYKNAWQESRINEIRNPRALQKLTPGRPDSVQSRILQVMDREMTCGDIQTALYKHHGIQRTTAQISSALFQMKKAGQVEVADKVVGLLIWVRT